MKYNYELFEDNAGGLHLAVLDNDDTCVYYLTDLHREIVLEALTELKNGGDPIADDWEGGEPNPQECYSSILAFVEAHNGGAWEVDDET